MIMMEIPSGLVMIAGNDFKNVCNGQPQGPGNKQSTSPRSDAAFVVVKAVPLLRRRHSSAAVASVHLSPE